MRFQRLHLLRFGALDDREITFRPDARLHIVFGPNEAGKSTTLSALSALLFGFPHQKTHDFLHRADMLRIAATVAARDGSELAFRRRRGNKATLLADNDTETALRDDALAPFIGGLTKTVFESAFGLNSTRLKEGAEAMLASDGELGGTLLAAASGLTGLRELRTEFENEASDLYAPRASTKEFNELSKRWDAARQKVRETELRSGDWKALNAEIERLERRHEEEKQQLSALIRRREELGTLKKLGPVVAEIDASLRKLETHSDLNELRPGFAGTLEKALEDQAASAEAFEEASKRLRDAEEAVAEIDVDENVLAQGKAISALHEQLGNYRKTREDLPAVAREQRGFAHDIEDRLKRLGLSVETYSATQPTDATLALAAQLAEDGKSLAREMAGLKKQIADERENEAGLDRHAPAGRLTDPKPHKDRMAALRPEIEAIEKAREVYLEHRTETRRIRDAALALNPPVADFERFVTVALPSVATVSTQAEQLEGIGREIGKTESELHRIDEEIARNAKILRETERGGEIPSRETIVAARKERDEAFKPIAASALGSAEQPKPAEAHALVESFTARIRSADDLADAAFDDVERVQRYSDLSARNAELEQEQAALEKALTSRREDRDRLHAEFAFPFEAIDVKAADPNRMIDWLKAMTDLRDAHRENERLSDQLSSIASREEVLRKALIGLAQHLWIEDAEALGTLPLVRAVGQRIEEMSQAWLESRDHAGRKRDVERRIERLEGQKSELSKRLELWRRDADSAFGKLGLAPGASPEEAAATIALWRELPGIERQRVNREERVRGMERDARRFEDETRALVSDIAPSWSDLPAERAVEDLQEESEIAYRASAKLAERKTAFERAARARDQRKAQSDAAETRLSEFLVACPGCADPEHLIERLHERDRLREAAVKSRDRLVDIAPAWSEDAVRQALDGFDPSRADLDLSDLESEERDLTAQSNETYAELREKLKEKEALSRGQGAEGAVFEQKAVEAEMLDLARRWAVLKIASNLVSATLDKHRQSQDAPLMHRAGERFKTLTAGAFPSLSQQFDENDDAKLMAVRENGERLRIDDLSDGTRDQLFLALRLAFIEDYASRNEPIPFIGDDIFQTFDDERTAAGLLTLADASEHMQPILFAHHRSVVEIAKERLGEDADIIEMA
ncbi:AAA family ATPase [Fulvimarina sp. MAC8]|uniref:AAA family ATPase n=1 Tax=Fulvimarina sp. MAC8 TaxID=3162874 RepID=UPI0032EAFDC6